MTFFGETFDPIARPAITPKPVLIASRTYEEAREFAERIGVKDMFTRWAWVGREEALLGRDRGSTLLILPNAWKNPEFSAMFVRAKERGFAVYWADRDKGGW